MKKIFNPVFTFITGLSLGIVSRLLDIYTQNLGNIFSQISVWILLGTIISIYSITKKKAMLNVLSFCIGMLITYYTVAIITNGVYSEIYIIGWTIFAFTSPIFAFLTWLTKEKGFFAKLIAVCIVIFSILSTILLFDKLRVYDFILNIILIYFLFIKKVKREN